MDILILILVLLVSIVLHELAHAWVARREGDDTAERLGRITLNPVRHLDPIGSLVVPAVLASIPGGFIFGWAKPVPVNPNNFRDPVWSDVRVSLAGIAVNLCLAVAFALLLVPIAGMAGPGSSDLWGVLYQGAFYGVIINLILAIFNLIPVPPLDGSHVFKHLLPQGLRPAYQGLGRFGLLLLIGVLWFLPGGFGIVMVPVMFLADLLFSIAGV